MFSTFRLAIMGLDFWLMTPALSSAGDWKFKENGSQPPRQMSDVSVNILIYCLNEHRVIFLAWNAHLELHEHARPLTCQRARDQ